MAMLHRIIPVRPHAIITMGPHNAAGGTGITPNPVPPPPRHRPDEPEDDDDDRPQGRQPVHPTPTKPASDGKPARQWRIMHRHLKSHGFTKNCRGCDGVRHGHKVAWKHTDACRNRMEGLLTGKIDRQNVADARNRRQQPPEYSYVPGQASSSRGEPVLRQGNGGEETRSRTST